ncbi:hypothetical protein [Bacterioplanoides sp.]|uniref:hypothetical protein n=1 Tax=Bacterioplanoides sp. TaxID=2066072 RepID=UPI003AFFE26B
MLNNLLRYVLIFVVLLTSNSQSLMAAQSLLTENIHQAEQLTDDLPSCHRTEVTDPSSEQSAIKLECERDCSCCNGSCSSFAITLDLPLALSGLQHFEVQMSSLASPLKRLESLQRPPIFA